MRVDICVQLRIRVDAALRAEAPAGWPLRCAAPATRAAARQIAEQLVPGQPRRTLGRRLQAVVPEELHRGHGAARREVEPDDRLLREREGALAFLLMHSTLVGAPSCSAMFGAPRMWQAMSPSAPQPKS